MPCFATVSETQVRVIYDEQNAQCGIVTWGHEMVCSVRRINVCDMVSEGPPLEHTSKVRVVTWQDRCGRIGVDESQRDQ